MVDYLGEAECPRCKRKIEFFYGVDDVSESDGCLYGTFECLCGQIVKIEYEYATPSFYARKVVE